MNEERCTTVKTPKRHPNDLTIIVEQRPSTAMHVLGHAHGFDHGPDNNVMYGVSKDICTLGSHDRQDYDDLWG